MQFLTRQYIDALAPSISRPPIGIHPYGLETKGESITQGIKNLISDMEKGASP
jgi:polyhydroxyalkanoate synthase